MKLTFKKHILFIFLYPFIILSQEPPGEKEKKTGLGVFVTPEYHSVLLKGNTGDRHITTRLSGSVGTQMNLTFGNNLVFRAGLGYSFRTFEYKISNLVFGDMIDPQQGYTGTPKSVRYDISFHEIQLPVAVHYKFSIPFFIGGGIDLIFPLANEGYMTMTDSHGPYTFENPFNAALSLSAGYRFRLDQKLYLLLEPVFRMNLKAYSLNNGHHYTAGIKTTIWIGGR